MDWTLSEAFIVLMGIIVVLIAMCAFAGIVSAIACGFKWLRENIWLDGMFGGLYDLLRRLRKKMQRSRKRRQRAAMMRRESEYFRKHYSSR